MLETQTENDTSDTCIQENVKEDSLMHEEKSGNDEGKLVKPKTEIPHTDDNATEHAFCPTNTTTPTKNNGQGIRDTWKLPATPLLSNEFSAKQNHKLVEQNEENELQSVGINKELDDVLLEADNLLKSEYLLTELPKEILSKQGTVPLTTLVNSVNNSANNKSIKLSIKTKLTWEGLNGGLKTQYHPLLFHIFRHHNCLQLRKNHIRHHLLKGLS